MKMTSMSITHANWEVMDTIRFNLGRGASMNDALIEVLVKAGYLKRDGLKIEIKNAPLEKMFITRAEWVGSEVEKLKKEDRK